MRKTITRRNRTLNLVAAVLLLCTGAMAAAPSAPRVNAQANGRPYSETGKTLAPEFVSYFDSHGGLPIFGYPISDAEMEGGYKVQYLERARLEYHPENRNSPYEVQLGLLGTILTSGRYFPPAPSTRMATTANSQYFPETGHTLSGNFLSYWQQYGGLALFGYPISEPSQENGVLVQYFERNRFEYHPEQQGTQYEVELGLLGRDLLAQRVQVGESSVTLPVYAYEQGFYTPQGDPVAPYPRLDRSKMGPLAPRTYRLLTLENRYLRLSVMPELGGRLYEAVYKPTGHDELYHNPVVKPSTFGARGWWLAAGGTEWAAPTDEHGLMEYLPWDATVQRNTDGGATVIVSATDKLTGMKVTGGVTLSPEEASYGLSARIENHTDQQQRGQLWTNTMLAPGGSNHVPSDARFVIPSSDMVVHSTSDPDLPREHGVISWPQQGGRDMSNMSSWKGWLGGFALPKPGRGNFAALYNPDADEGMVKSFGKDMPGLKIFGFGPGFDSSVYTDGDSSYAELWGGITPTFWDYAIFPPNGALGWSERWQPVAGLGGVSLASGWGTVSYSGSEVRILPARRVEGATLVIYGPGGQISRQPFNAYPDKPAALTVAGPVEQIEVLSASGQSLLKGIPVEP